MNIILLSLVCCNYLEAASVHGMLLNGMLFVLCSVGRSNDDGAGHKAALLSGPPGIGKTTTAQIVCEVYCTFTSLAVSGFALLTFGIISTCLCFNCHFSG